MNKMAGKHKSVSSGGSWGSESGMLRCSEQDEGDISL